MTNQTNIIYSIVPRLPPAIDGVGDYALNLARQLRQDHAVQTHFIVCDPAWKGETAIEGFPINQLSDRSANSLLYQLKQQNLSTILLHYVGYGYAKRGCPIWLTTGLKQWKAAKPDAKLVTMFHELYASGPIWTSAFWLSPLQQNLVSRLTRLSCACITNRQAYAALLHRLNSDKAFQTLPVFSNIGEPTQVSQLADRSKRLVIFGSRNARLWVFEQCLTALQRICTELEIKEICDIGAPTGLLFPDLIDVPVVEKGICSAQDISAILADAIASFSNFPPPQFFGKSTVYAAYCAHKLLPITAFPYAPITDGLQGGKHYWSMHQQPERLSLEMAQAIANRACDWYQDHTLSKQATVFARHWHTHSINSEADNELLRHF